MRIVLPLIILFFSLNVLAQKELQPPNILFILVDDLGYKDLGCYGSTFYDTPNLDALAATSTQFTHAYSASPVCSPTRAAIMTGKDPVRVNITDWIPGMPTFKADSPQLIPPDIINNLPLEEETLAEAFAAKGYKTFFAGKWHLGETEEYWPEKQGFADNKGGHHKGSPPGGYYSPYENPRLSDGPEGEYLTDRLTGESIQFLESTTNQPFFLYLAFYTVHTPIQGCNRYDDHYLQKKESLPDQGDVQIFWDGNLATRVNQSDAKYAAMVRAMDENVGRLIKKLDQLGLTENTIIVFTSDNGGLATQGKNPGPTAVYPLRKGKGWLYEGGIRIPLLIKAAGQKVGIITEQPTVSMDLYPTLLQMAGLAAKPNQHQDGVNILSALYPPDETKSRTLVWHYPHYHGSSWRPGSAIRSGNWKLIEFYEDDKVELYNLAEDTSEQNDLSKTKPEIAKNLREQMHTYIKARGGKYPVRKQN